METLLENKAENAGIFQWFSYPAYISKFDPVSIGYIFCDPTTWAIKKNTFLAIETSGDGPIIDGPL